MSRTIFIRSKLYIENENIAKKVIDKLNLNNLVYLKNNYFEYIVEEEFIQKNLISKVENEYLKQLNIHEEEIKKAKLKKQEEKLELIIKNAQKQGYKVKTKISKDNKISLVLQKRVY